MKCYMKIFYEIFSYRRAHDQPSHDNFINIFLQDTIGVLDLLLSSFSSLTSKMKCSKLVKFTS